MKSIRSLLLRGLAASLGLLVFCVAAWHTLATTRARAQDRFAVEAFDPAPTVEGSVLAVYGARTLPKRGYSFSIMGSYGRRPLSLEGANSGAHLGDLVGSIGTLNLMGAIGLWERLDLGVALPIHRVSRGSDFNNTAAAVVQGEVMESTDVALGDLRLVPRVSLLARDRDQGVGLALLLPLSLPTGKDASYAGERFRVEPRVAVDWLGPRGLLVAANVGYLVRNATRVLGHRVDDILRIGVGTDVPIAAGFSALVEVNSHWNVRSLNFGRTDAPLEGLLGARFRKHGWLAQLGGGPGINRGITAPRYRLFASVTYSRIPPPDRDGDGVLDSVDECPEHAEDRDGFEDEDGCPDPDNDQDSIPDVDDRCPNEAEDHDGFRDEDGCPEPDNDQDDVLDADDQCLYHPEDHDGFRDEDGCPDPDNDEDGIPDAEDKCPNEAETVNGFEDEDGCPESDSDGDGVVDALDACPDEPGLPESEGCPPKVAVTETAITLREPVFFETARATIEARSFALLDEIATVLNSHPEITLVVVEGHTDNRGSAYYNRKLSKQRADAVVEALVQREVQPGRLTTEGIGPAEPVASNDTEEGRAQNRRVELNIKRRAAQVAE